jgi:poly(3-hydroxybutyrate) depolymerase
MLARQTIRPCLSLGLAAWALAFSGAAGGAPALEQVAAGVNIDPRQISVSGISSGGFMAHQFHVAHSEHIMGAGIVAGGPYYCARGTILDAVTRCSQFVMLECSALGLDARWCKNSDLAPGNRAEIERVADASFAEAEKQEAAGTISKLANLRNSKVYLFSGAHDNIVPLGVMDALFHFYADTNKGGVAAGNMAYNRTFPARHTMVRDSFDKPAGEVVGQCPLPPAAPPPTDKDAYIDDCEAVAKAGALKNHCLCPPGSAAGAAAAAPCPPRGKEAICQDLDDVDLAGAILKRIYGEQALKAVRVPVAESAVQAFDQRQVFGKFSDTPYNALQNASMAREGYVFIPAACKDGRPCKLHVAFHGCRQGGATDARMGHSGNLFAKFAGYSEWAQANEIVVLYPQIQARGGAFPLTPPLNPRGCWDWWGQNYTHTAYHTQHGTQIKAVAQMINILVGGQKLLEIPAE